MTIVTAVLARVVVEDLDAALPLYERLSGATPRRFNFRDVELAWVGSFLLLKGDPQAIAKYQRVATLIVSDLRAATDAVAALGGDVIEGPSEAPNGQRMIAQHPDGAVFEYIQPR
jgi:predicted enzyme related to lactoylglutathione lyase